MTELGNSPPPLGKIDQVALWLYEQWIGVTDSDDWLELTENLTAETTNVDIENEERFYNALDKVETTVMMRAARAVLNNLTNQPDRVAQAAFQRSTERPMQT